MKERFGLKNLYELCKRRFQGGNQDNFSGMTERTEYIAEGSSRSPQIDFNQMTGELILSGKSIPENAAKVYEPLLSVIDEYIKSPREVTNFRLNLEYFNTASLLWFARIVKALCKIEKDDSLLFIHIYFDVEDYESMDIDEIKDIVFSLIANIGKSKVSMGLKIYGIGDNNKVVREATILT